ncbi:hopanoid biosynthesis-associated protein HpnK [Caulobacter sp. KR2-114]|uniref:hopanoid biosynthesis-associated protein HpnK n=1 Tax=Caulobacter sp. KR2-114 TaxID=3400912 RepID=UPI003BFDFA43
MQRALIVTADDFGLSREVNEAVEAGHVKGVLTCASLVVAGAGAEDAMRRARALPNLGVGLHLAMLDAPSAAPAAEIGDLIDPATGALAARPFVNGVRIALTRRGREQARREMRAQFEGFRRSGLPLDHVDGHWHFHQHPTLTGLLIEMAADYGVKAVRAPNEPVMASWRAAGRKGLAGRAATAAFHAPLWNSLRTRLKRAGIGVNDWFFGLNDGGHMDAAQMLRTIANLPPGVSEIGLHPASSHPPAPHAPPSHWKLADELAGLMHPEVIAAAKGVRLGRFSDLVAA